MIRSLSLALLTLTTAGRVACAQNVPLIVPAVGIGFLGLSVAALVRLGGTPGGEARLGSVIRLTPRDEQQAVRGRLTGITADSIELATDSATVRFGRREVRSVEIHGTERQWAQGWRTGLIVGGATVGALGFAASSACEGDCVVSRGAATLALTAVGAVGGSMIGALLGAARQHERWRRATGFSAPALGVVPVDAHRIGLGAQLVF